MRLSNKQYWFLTAVIDRKEPTFLEDQGKRDRETAEYLMGKKLLVAVGTDSGTLLNVTDEGLSLVGPI